MKIKDYEIVEEITDEENYEYEEMTFGELLEKAELNEEEKNNALRSRFAINIHHLVAMENFDQLMETLQDRLTDPRLSKLNAIVMLSLKKCGRGTGFNVLPQSKFKQIVKFALENNIAIGFDSCSCHRFLDSIKDLPESQYKQMEMMSEPCESTKFSSYISTEGKFYACSFCEEAEEFGEGIDVVNCNDFVKDVWMHERTVNFRNKLLNNGSQCPVYRIYDKEN